jgi:hypothetical protein
VAKHKKSKTQVKVHSQILSFETGDNMGVLESGVISPKG